MNTPVIFLDLEQVLFLHEDQVEQYGGSHGLRNLALLESAILRPQSTFGGQDLYPTLFDKASALIHSLLLNHPFVDGNKRTATAAVIVFLALNGYELQISNKKLVAYALNIENKKTDREEIAAWLKKHSKKINI